MRVDSQTLEELDLFTAADGSPGLLGHLDRTRARGGREALRRRFTTPLESADDIVGVQASLKWSNTNPVLDRLPDEAAIAAVLRYLASRFTTLTRLTGPALRFESAWVRWRHPDLYSEARNGLESVRTLLARTRDLAIALGEAPGPVGAMAGELWHILESKPLVHLRASLEARSTWHGTLVLDRIVRAETASALERVIAILYELDALRSMAVVTAEKGFEFPHFADGAFEIEGLWHPFVTSPVGNGLQLRAHERVVFLTGPNMAGKTTYLKAAGIVVLLAHTGMGVPARGCRLPFVNRLIAALRAQDSVREGISYFQAEARRMRSIADALASTAGCFVLVDEPFRGTNVKDACDASLAVLRAFARVESSRFLIASHLIELAAELEALPGVVFRHFEARLAGEDVTFDYRIRGGVSDQRLGMKVLEREGVLRALETLGAGRPASSA